jgi:hypothetical protein
VRLIVVVLEQQADRHHRAGAQLADQRRPRPAGRSEPGRQVGGRVRRSDRADPARLGPDRRPSLTANEQEGDAQEEARMNSAPAP